MAQHYVAVDIGGTFTDLFSYNPHTGELFEAKQLSTPHNFAVGVMNCARKAGLDLTVVDTFVHGSTVAINTAIERTGARTALLVTRGTRDVYQIARGNRPDAYDIFFERAEPLAPPHLTFEIDQRSTASGDVLIPFNEAQARGVAELVASLGVEAVAICFLHSYENPADEAAMEKIMRELHPGAFITSSHQIVRKYGEYERMSTTTLNAYIGPRTSNYLTNLESLLLADGFGGPLLIMQSNGGLMSSQVAKQVPVAMMESGPVGGVIAAAQIGGYLGFGNTIAFDMGGTTAKASLIRGREPSIVDGYYIGGYASGQPAMLPVVDIVEVGTGGGSIAWIDEVGAFKVGPRSSGATPGPACYGRGGADATVTDANVVLGRIGDLSFLGGEMPLDRTAATQTLAELGAPFGLDATTAALDVVQIAVSNMALAVRGVSVERGYDPREFALIAMGGAGPVHATAIARELDIPVVIVPRLPAHFSALGMLMSDLKHDYVRTHLRRFDNVDFAEVGNLYAELEREGRQVLSDEGVTEDAMSFHRQLDLRYEGQEFAISVPIRAEEIARQRAAEIRRRFDEIHDQSFGHAAPDEPLELINVRVSARGERPKVRMPDAASGYDLPRASTRKVCFDDPERPVDCQVFQRPTLPAGALVEGPAVIEEYASTTVLFAGDIAEVANSGELIIRLKGGRS